MQIVAELDAGPILLQKTTKIGERETAPELMTRLADMGAELISETLANLDDIEPKPQMNSEATFAPILKREDGLIDWSLDAFAIERRVRGFQTWPTAHTTFGSHRLIIWTAVPEWIEQLQFPTGQVIEATRDRLIVACGNRTALRVLEIQPQDSRRMSARDFLNGVQLRVGTKLGD
jgi:methionyl-tRNA formyltransferase